MNREELKRKISESTDMLRNQSTLRFLKTIDPEDYLDDLLNLMYLYTRPKRGKDKNIYLVEAIIVIGRGIRKKYKQIRDTGIDLRAGAFFVRIFEDTGILRALKTRGSSGHATYAIDVLNDNIIRKLWKGIPSLSSKDKMPSDFPYPDWTKMTDENGKSLIKTNDREVLKSVCPETHPIVFECVNRSQKTGWRIDPNVFEIAMWALESRAGSFNDIWQQTDKQAYKTKLREANTILDIAGRFLDKPLYHKYSYDFRGRKYPDTAYLHESGCDLAKGLLKRNEKKAITEAGFHWLCIHLANCAGMSSGDTKTDKLKLEERIAWALKNKEVLISYGVNPKVNTGWMTAEEPWQFLGACFEFQRFLKWQAVAIELGMEDIYSYESDHSVWLDGTTNGPQHLTALALDDRIAPYVNLVKSEYPGDLYKYVGDAVWTKINEEYSTFSKADIKELETILDDLIELKKKINELEPRSTERAEKIEFYGQFKKAIKDLMEALSVVFWNRIVDSKEKRKITKRSVMTMAYGATVYGMGQQVIDDANKHGIPLLHYMEHRFASFLGKRIYEACGDALEKPMILLNTFEYAGKMSEAAGEFLKWTVPITNFPVVQHYTEGKVKRVLVPYGDQKLLLSVAFPEEPIQSRRKQALGAAPNIIHSFDAAHLMLTVVKADFTVTTVHDSFGALLGDAPKLFKLLRETFVEFYETDPLTSVMKDIDGIYMKASGIGQYSPVHFEKGNLDIGEVRKSDYAFS